MSYEYRIANNNLQTDRCQIQLDLIYRYDSTTGTFTVPPGGDGYYYFSAFLTVDGGERVYFDVEVNGEVICTVFSDLEGSFAGDSETTSCNGVAYAVEGTHKQIYFAHI